jgi:hypothetical protein
MVLRLFLIDVALALLALLMILGWGVSLELCGALYLMTVVITNVILLRHDRSRAAQPEEALQREAKPSCTYAQRFSLSASCTAYS